ncbi:MAG: DUF2207 domain-containing protein [Patescibacteria group bacterium]|nr:DUF2207 domain-containing protein [Patescibacteria group bacterium]
MKLKFFLFTLFVLGSLAFFPQKILADSESIKSFRSKITLHKDGTFNVEENIQYDFGANSRHGIFRYIPLTSRVGNYYRTLKVSFLGVLLDGENEKYSTNYSGDSPRFAGEAGKAYIKIGNANKTISGEHDYIIYYKVGNGIGNFSDHDELYWNITGNDWQVPIESAKAQILPDFDTQIIKSACYTGPVGGKEQKCRSSETLFDIFTTDPLLTNEGLTIVAGFPVKTFPLSKIDKNPPGTINPVFMYVLFIFLIIFSVVFYIALPIVLIVWYFKNKRKNRFGPVTVNFDIPKDEINEIIRPAEAGTIDTAKLEKDDVVATIFDLAIRKYIKIKEIEKKKAFAKDKKDYLISKLKNYDKDKLTLYEKDLLDELFSESNEIELSSISKNFYKTFSGMDDHVFLSLIKRGYYKKNPKTQRGFLIAGCIVSFLMFNFMLGFILLLFSRVLNGRTAIGDEIDWKIDGLKLFLKSVDRNYKWQAEQLAIVEDMIPYAIALGYIDKFMEQLKIIKPDYKPSWYVGNTAFYIASTNMFSTMNSTFATVAPSSASGFSSGGFSGGGGGGGGGGSW